MMKNKNLLVAIFIILGCYSLLSQDIIDPPKLNQLVNSNIIKREQNKFIRGWTCGSPGNMLDSAMFINTYCGYENDSLQGVNQCTYDLLFITRPGHSENNIVGGRNNYSIFNAHSLYLDPSLVVDTTQGFVPRPNENTGAVMGFLDKDTTVSDTAIDQNGNGHLLLYQNYLYDDSVKVLSNIWKNDCLRWLDYDGGDKGGDEKERTNHDTLNSDIDRKTYYVGANGSERTPLQAQAMQFDARLKIDPTKDFNFLENDNLQSIFGLLISNFPKFT